MPKPLKIVIREKILTDGQTASLYLDFNRSVWNESKQKTIRYHFLELFVYRKAKTRGEREHNRFVREQAEKTRGDVYREIVTGVYGTRADAAEKIQDGDFLAFFRGQQDLRRGATRKGWENAYKKFVLFSGESVKFRNITARFALEYKDFLANQKLAGNTRRDYFSKFSALLGEAYKRDLIKEDIARKVKGFSAQTGKRAFLTEKEIQILRNTPFDQSPVLRRAAFFSILTSLRWDDIRHLTYEQLKHSDELGWFIDFEIRKTDRPDILYLNREALALCEYESEKTGAIFPMRYREKDKVIEWFIKAGIDKGKGGFHIFRHTFAMRSLNKGENLAVVKEMMGHRSIKSTEHYAKLLGSTKRDASMRQSIED